jgi:hypothetical protein
MQKVLTAFQVPYTSRVREKLNDTNLGKWRDLSSLMNTAVPVCTGLFSGSDSE